MRDSTKILTLLELIGVVNDWEGCNPEPGSGTHWIWYRGQSRASDEAVPGAERPPFVAQAEKNPISPRDPFALEKALNTQFLRLGASFFHDDKDLVRIYFLAQHYGLPTRLLDWTTNPLAALFFAASDRDEIDGKLFVAKFNRMSQTKPKDPQTERGNEVVKTIRFLFGGRPKPPAMPGIIPVLPSMRFPRMMRQGSCFTLHMPGADKLQLISGGKPNSRQEPTSYVIPGCWKKDMRDQLRRLGVTWAAFFPELDYLAKEIRASFGL